jgi:DNA-directed RNA polymerase subunit RPC12/RpoP
VSDLFYLQDSRSYVGNDVLWWAKGDGYTTDLSKARLFTKEDAQRHHNARETDIPWPKYYIDAKTRPAVDMQYIRRDEALRGTGILLAKPRRPRAYTFNCSRCGRFLRDADRYSLACPNCGADNRP